MKKFSFTLIELLVVISIISVLAALLMPALRTAKLNALDIKCASNERQIHMAIVMYCNDHNNLYPSPITWDHQHQQLALLSNYVQNQLRFFRCPLAYTDAQNGVSAGDLCNAPGSTWSTNISGTLQWTEYKINDYNGAGKLVNNDFGSQLRPSMIVVVIDANDGIPRHRGNNNVCFFDGHIEKMLATKTSWPASEPGSPTGWPWGWWAWGIDPY